MSKNSENHNIAGQHKTKKHSQWYKIDRNSKSSCLRSWEHLAFLIEEELKIEPYQLILSAQKKFFQSGTVLYVMTPSEVEVTGLKLIIRHNSGTHTICSSPIGGGYLIKRNYIWLETHIKQADNTLKEFFFIDWCWEKTPALGNAPSGMNTLKAFITRFMATNSFHPWFLVLFRQGWNRVSLCFLWCLPSR